METTDLFFSNPLPPLAERLEIIEIIRDQFKITPEQLNELLKTVCQVYVPVKLGGFRFIDPVNTEPVCYETGLQQAIAAEKICKELTLKRRELIEISKAIAYLETGEPKTVEFHLKINRSKSKSRKTVKITSPYIISGLVEYFKALPPPATPPPAPKVGRAAKSEKKGFLHSTLIYLVNVCPIDAPPKEKLFFAALALAYIGAEETPARYDHIIIYKNTITDRLGYYLSGK